MGDVYDFRTGQLCKCCTSCKFWKGVLDFPIKEIGKYGRGAVCKECLAAGDESLRPSRQPTKLPSAEELNQNWVDQAEIIFEMGEGDDDDETA